MIHNFVTARLGAGVALAALALAACGAAGAAYVSTESNPQTTGTVSVGATPTPSPTPSPEPSPRILRFAVLGDFGTGSDVQWAVARRMCTWRKTHPFDVVITTGDNIYENGEPALFDSNFSEPYSCLLDNGVRFHASLGNHDVRTAHGYFEVHDPRFGMKGWNYVVRNSGVRFVIANSTNIKRWWLKRALRRQAGDRWKVVVFHHPVYSPGTVHGSRAGFHRRLHLPRLFRNSGVDLVFNGHDHIYSASKPLNRIRYVVTGGGGNELYGCRSRWFSAVCRARHHFVYVVARPERITVKAVSRWGVVFHAFRTRGRPAG